MKIEQKFFSKVEVKGFIHVKRKIWNIEEGINQENRIKKRLKGKVTLLKLSKILKEEFNFETQEVAVSADGINDYGLGVELKFKDENKNSMSLFFSKFNISM